MIKKKSRWIPYKLTLENKQKRKAFSKDMLKRFESGQLRAGFNSNRG
jgi:hypothetical protein